MAEDSKIEWTDHTFNPWMGCTKVSPACTNCYAERDFDHRYGKVKWGPNGDRKITADDNWRKPLRWNREAESKGVRYRVFCASLADVFEDWGSEMHDHQGNAHFTLDGDPLRFVRSPDAAGCDLDGYHYTTMNDVRHRLFHLIDSTPNLDWLLLTKRPENIRRMWVDEKKPWRATGQWHRDNVWLGTSVENQEFADKRIPELLKCQDLSPVLFLSCEPLVGPVELAYPESIYPDGPPMCCSGFECGCRGLPCDPPAYLNRAFGGVDWVIAGGESGPGARPCDPSWFRSLRDQCLSANVPFHFKQWGEFDEHQNRVGKKNAGRLLDGQTHDGLPQLHSV